MVLDLEHGDAIVAVALGPEEYHIIVRPILQFLTNELDKFVFDPATVNAGRLHTAVLVLLVHNVINIVRKVRIVDSIENRINNQPLAFLALSLGFCHGEKSYELYVRIRHYAFRPD